MTNTEAHAPALQANEEGLFRADALKAFGQRNYGRPVARMPRLWTALAGSLAVMVGASAVFVTTSTYARKEGVVGWLMPDRGLVRLTTGAHGQVERIAVEEGDYVEAGATLIVLTTDKGLEGGGRSTETVLSELDREGVELRKQLKLLGAGSEIEHRSVLDSIGKLEAERRTVADQVGAQKERVRIAREVMERFQGALSDDASSPVEVARYEDAYSSQLQSQAQLAQRSAGLDRELAQLRAKARSGPMEAERRASELRGRLSTVARQRAELESRGRMVLSAPVSGRVATLTAQAGGTVMPSEVLASIVPEGSELYAQVYVPSRAIGFVSEGQDVRLMYQPFPHQRYGSAWGEVERISRTVLRPEEIPTAIGLEEPAYKARVRLDRQDVEAFGQSFPLRPGMALSGEVIQERRTFLQWLLEPLRARRGKERREVPERTA